MTEMSYIASDIPELRYVKLTYTAQDNKVCEIITKIRLLSDDMVSLYTESDEIFDINCPQKITMKFVAEDCAYVSITTLLKVSRVNHIVYFTVQPPQTIYKQQNRKYYRINLQRSCVLVTTDKQDFNTIYMAKLVDVSAGGTLIHCLETISDNKSASLKPEECKAFKIILFLDVDLVLNLSAKYVRQDCLNEHCRYAFEFIHMKTSDTDLICQYVTKKQLEQLQSKNK